MRGCLLIHLLIIKVSVCKMIRINKDKKIVFPGNISVSEMKLAAIESPCCFADILIPPGVSTPVDSHREHECWYVISGYGKLTCDAVDCQITEGEMLCFFPFESHMIENHSESPMRLISFWWAA